MDKEEGRVQRAGNSTQRLRGRKDGSLLRQASSSEQLNPRRQKEGERTRLER